MEVIDSETMEEYLDDVERAADAWHDYEYARDAGDSGVESRKWYEHYLKMAIDAGVKPETEVKRDVRERWLTLGY